MFLELNTIGCSLLVFFRRWDNNMRQRRTPDQQARGLLSGGLASLPGHRGTDRGTGLSNSPEAMPRSANWPSRAAPACLRFRSTPRVLEEVVRRQTMRDDLPTILAADSVDLAGSDGSVDSGVVGGGNLGGAPKVQGGIRG